MIHDRSKMKETTTTTMATKNPTSTITRQDSIQCDAAKVALYSLPNNLNFDTIDFEQCILECIKNKLDERKPETGLSKRMINEIELHHQMIPIVDDNNSEQKQQCQQIKYSVAIHKNKLLWTVSVMPPTTEDEATTETVSAIKSSTTASIDIIKNSDYYYQHCFDDIKLCYVNYQQMSNMIIWLIMSMPKRIVGKTFCDYNINTVTAAKQTKSDQSSSLSSSPSSSSSSSLYALVWKCFNEQDVIQLRDVYKYQQSLKRLSQMESLITQQNNQNDNDDSNSLINRIYPIPKSRLDDLSINGKIQNQNNDENNHSKLLSRQRQPAKIIQEKSSLSTGGDESNMKNYLEQIPTKKDWKKNKSINNQLYKYLTKSESEFDTTQINMYLRQKRLNERKRSSSCHGTRSRSIDTNNNGTISNTPITHIYEMPIDDINGKLPPPPLLPPSVLKTNTTIPTIHNKSLDKSFFIKSFVTDLLNSEGSSLSDESSSGEFNDNFSNDDYNNHNHSKHKPPQPQQPIIVKSVLKKTKSDEESRNSGSFSSSTLSSPRSHFSSSLSILSDKLRFGISHKPSSWSNGGNPHHKKNVTFSAYATIQVVDT